MNTNATRERLDARRSTVLRRRLLPVLIAGCFSGGTLANPVGPQVVNGQVSFSNQGNVLSVTNTPGSIINWQSFSINPGEITRFIQQNPNSAVLNRIIGQDPSQILGVLQSNGRVFLINPNGILFGQGAQVDVNGLVASTLNISNEDFLNGKMNFKAGEKAGSLKNQGVIATPDGGQVFLIAPNVENSGIITSPKGNVLLAAGHSVQLVDTMNPDLHVVVSAPENEAINLGQIIAQGGKTGIYGALVKQRGIVNANSAVVGENGKVVLKASKDTLLEAGSRTTATSVGKGGEIHVLGNRVALTGDAQIDASGRTGGGTVLVGGDYQGKNSDIHNAARTYVGPDTQIRVDATEAGDGGKAIVWADEITRAYGSISARGGQQGGNGGLVETSAHSLDVSAIRVDATAPKGKNGTWLLDPIDITIAIGGGVTVDDVNQFIDLGGVTSIDPGTLDAAAADIFLQAENDITINNNLILTTAGADMTLQAGRSIAVNAALQTAGAGNITLIANNVDGSETDAAGAGLAGSLGANRSVGVASLNVAGTITTASGDIKIVNSSATGAGGQPGAVTIQSGITTGGNVTITGQAINWNTGNSLNYNGSGAGGKTLTLQAVGNIAFDGMIYDSALGSVDKFNVILNANRSGTGGAIGLNGADIATNGGDITLGGGNDPTNNPALGTVAKPDGIVITGNSNLSAGGGTIRLRGQGYAGTSGAEGILINGNSTLQAGTGTITMHGTGGAGTDNNNGIHIYSTTLSSSNGGISLTGTAAGTDHSNEGVYLDAGATITATGAAPVTINGNGAGANNSNYGVDISQASISTVNGAMSITGTGSGTGGSSGVRIAASNVSSSGISTIDITGTGAGVGTGLYIDSTSAATAIAGGSGAMTLTAGGTDPRITTAGANAVTISGTGALTLQPLNAATHVQLDGTQTAGDFHLSAATLSKLQNGFSGITFGRANGTGGVSVEGNTTLTDSVVLRSPSGGSIDLDASIDVGANQLTLNAGASVTQSAGIINADKLLLLGSGNFDVYKANVINTAAANVSGNIKLGTDGAVVIGTVDTTDGITASGGVTLNATNAVTQSKPISANSLELLATGSGQYTLTDSNSVGTLAANVPNALSFTNSGALTVGSVGSTNGVATTGLLKDVALTSTGSTITVANTSAADDLSATGIVTLQSAGNFTSIGGSSIKGTRVAVSTTAGGDVNLGGNVTSTETGAGPGIATLQVAIGTASNHAITTVGTLTAASGRIDITGQGGNITINGPVTQQDTAGAVKIASQDAVAGGGTISGTGLITSNAIDLQNVAGVAGPRVIGSLNTASIDATGTTFKIGNTTPGEVTSLSINHTGKATFPGASFFLGANAPVNIEASGDLAVPVIASGTSNLVLKSTTGTLSASGALAGYNVSLTAGSNFAFSGNVSAANDLFIDLTTADAKLTLPAALSFGGNARTIIKADKMDFSAAGLTVGAAASSVMLLPKSSGRAITLGSDTTDAGSDLELSATELNRVLADTLNIGDTTSGVLNVDAAIAPSSITTLALSSGNTIGQTASITATNLAVKALENVTLNVTNNVANLVAFVGDSTHKNRDFSFRNGPNALNVGSGIASMSGITIDLDLTGYDPASPNGVISLTSGTALTQSAGATLNGKAVYAEGTKVLLNQSNATGVIAGKATGAAAGDVFKYTSSNGIWVTKVNGFFGIDAPSVIDPVGVELTGSASGISQSSTAPITTATGLILNTTGAVNLLGGSNNVAALSAAGVDSINFRNIGALTLGVSGTGVSTTDGTINIYADGLLTVKNAINAGIGNLSLKGRDIQIGVGGAPGTTIDGDIVELRANKAGAAGTISTAGTSASTVTSDGGMLIEADNLDFSAVAPTFTAADEIGYKTYSDGRSITIGAACNAADPACLKISGMTNIAPDLVIGVESASDSNTAGNIHVDAPLSNAGGRIALLSGGGIDQSGTGTITAGVFGFRVGTVNSGSGVTLNLANSIGAIAGTTQGGAVSLTNTPALSVVQVTAGDPAFSDITAVNGITTNNGNVTFTNTGNIALNAPISAGTGTVTLDSGVGISGTGTVSAGTLNATASSGIGHATALSTAVGNLNVSNSGANTDISILNSGDLSSLSAHQTLGGSTGVISIVNYGDMSVTAVSSKAGTINLNAYHKLTVSGSVTSTSGPISLSATGTGTAGNGDDLVINGSVTSTSGNITLSAGDYITISNPANVNAGTGTITKNEHLNGPIVVVAPAPTLTDCTSNPNLSGCESVLPTLDTCTTDPTKTGCTAVLPTLDTCTTNPTKTGCTAVLPTLDTCTTDPTKTGCTAVLPTLDTCTTNPTQAGCTAVLPTLDTCTTNPTKTGCTAVLPTLDTCTTNPTKTGCTAVLPTLATCTTNPTQTGCTAVLPTLDTCTTNPTQAGCTAVLPTLDTCTTNPTKTGCTAVLPTLDTCTTNPTKTGCTAVLPTLDTCTTNPTQAGCTAVLPTLDTCTTNPTKTGCTAVLPTLDTCTANPTQAGCTAVLPTLDTCTTNPTKAGCTAVLPTLTSCTTNKDQAGCAAVLPLFDVCKNNPRQDGCSAVLPKLSTCEATPTLDGCNAVLPSISDCSANPNLAGCAVVLPIVSKCTTNPSLPECETVLPPTDLATVAAKETMSDTINATVNQVVTTTLAPQTSTVTAQAGATTASTGSGSTGGAGSANTTSTTSSANRSGATSTASSEKPAETRETSKEEKKDDKKDEKKTTTGPDDSGAKKNEPAKKMYCN